LRQVAVVVEGQTEEAFVSEVLAPYLWGFDTHITPIVVETARAASGKKYKGGGPWVNYERDLRKLLGESHWAVVTTMIDFYAYPSDAPGAACVFPHAPRTCVEDRESAMKVLFDDGRFVPFVVLHEFETFVIASSIGRPMVLGSADVATALQSEAAHFNDDVEMINDSPETAPSKRVARLWPQYAKVTDGVAVVGEAGLDAVLDVCPHFADWVAILRGDGLG
jgi:hypothetical protein